MCLRDSAALVSCERQGVLLSPPRWLPGVGADARTSCWEARVDPLAGWRVRGGRLMQGCGLGA